MAKEKWLVTGASGLLGTHLCRHLIAQSISVTGVYHSHPINVDGVNAVKLDITDHEKLESFVHGLDVDVIVHSAALTNVDECEEQEGLAQLLHAETSQCLANLAKEKKARYVYISTDHLWDGSQEFIAETKTPNPINAYARTKLSGEQLASEANSESLIVRTNFFGPGQKWHKSFSDWVINAIRSGQELTGFDNVYFTPISVYKLCETIVRLVQVNAVGIFNVTGSERISKYTFMIRLAKHFGLDERLIKCGLMDISSGKVRRPLDMSMDVRKVENATGWKMPGLDDSFREIFKESAS